MCEIRMEERVFVHQRKLSPVFVDSFQAWRRYDTDRSGYIEANELKVRYKHKSYNHFRECV